MLRVTRLLAFCHSLRANATNNAQERFSRARERVAFIRRV
jgi:hypothetical protein